MKIHHQLISSIIVASAITSSQVSFAAVNQAQVTVEQSVMTQAELAQLLSPIALYPDALLTHILIAATYPIEVIDADRLVKRNKHASSETLQKMAQDKDWDPSVSALLAFPQVLEKLSEDLTWMRELGDAFLQDEEQVLASIQLLRQQADEAGNLAKMDNVQIIREQKTIVIQPEQPEVIYVPYYDTRSVYGRWHWSHRPPIYWHRPVYYSYHNGPFYWRSGIHLAADFFFVGFHWHNRHVIHHSPKYYRNYHSKKRVTTSHRVKRWQHNPHRRKGVAYRNHEVKKRYASHRSVNKPVKRARTYDARSKAVKKHHVVTKKLREHSNKRIIDKGFRKQTHAKNKPLRNSLHRKATAGNAAKERNRQQIKAIQRHDKRIEQRNTVKKYHRVEKRKSYLSSPKATRVKQPTHKKMANTQVRKSHLNKPIKVSQKRIAKGGHSSSNKTYTRVTRSSHGKQSSVPSSRKIKPRRD
ncbi:DUF3300 domain-containing protein [Thalassotalea sp. PP2-459]|uniref:DUF3300 domain-containing protein n=1 Tax=Thalassotalea sp. PP2-459 TaxID=1742724 RepID=UPI000944436D|nr:DUF3300 domain-containing protein [Thalassotalea sp. PP2-459]OKY27454.1 hypothetical protein BI291_09180 [Thalassotalea sp. PP2-459]